MDRKKNRLNFRTLLLANTLAAGAALLVMKFATFLYIVSGAEGQTPFFKTFGKVFLCLGWDVVGAAIAGLVISLLAWPFIRKNKWVWVVSGVLQAAHVFFLWVSYVVNKTVGAPLGKPAIDLTWRNSDKIANETAFTLGSSSASNVNFPNIVVVTLAVAGILLFLWWTPRFLPGLKRRWKAVLLFFAIGFPITTIVLLPNMRNGDIMGIRVHTYSMERSAIPYLIKTYIDPLKNRIKYKDVYHGDSFRFDMKSIVAPDKNIPPPLAGAIPQKTNLVVVILESVGHLDYSAVPTPMPHLRALGKTGADFETHYTTWPQTMKAVFSFYCSELPYPDYRSITRINPSIPCISLPLALKRAGYRTALIISDDFSYDRKLRFFKHQGFDTMLDSYTQPGHNKAWHNSWGVPEKLSVKNVMGWIDRQKGHRFAVFYNMVTGHHPYSFEGFEPKIGTLKEEHESYIKCLGYIDDRIQQVMDGLRKRGLADNTLVVVFSDHGEGFGRHVRTFAHGPVAYEEVIRVPLVMAGPQFKPIAGRRVTIPTSHIDTAPTILGLMDIPVPFTMKGRNLLKSRDNRIVLFGSRPPEAQLGLRDGRWKFILTQETGTKELFDLSKDPMETKNLATKFPKLEKRFYTRVIQWQAFSKELIEDYQSIVKKYKNRQH